MKYSKQTGGFNTTEIHGSNIPEDAIEISGDFYQQLLEGQAAGKRIVATPDGYTALENPAPPSQADIIKQYETALDAHLDAVAKTYRYDDRKSFALRAGYVGPYQMEGIAFAQWMDSCNVQAYALLQSVIAGEVTMPTIEEMIAGLPGFSL